MNYTNDRREGKTQPDLVEIIGRDDPRHALNNLPLLGRRASARKQGLQSGNIQRRRRTLRLKPAPHPLRDFHRFQGTLSYAEILGGFRQAVENTRRNASLQSSGSSAPAS